MGSMDTITYLVDPRSRRPYPEHGSPSSLSSSLTNVELVQARVR